jgi:hypothetical protein
VCGVADKSGALIASFVTSARQVLFLLEMFLLHGVGEADLFSEPLLEWHEVRTSENGSPDGVEHLKS